MMMKVRVHTEQVSKAHSILCYLELSSRSKVGTSSSCLVTMPKEALTATESDPLMLNPTSLMRWFPNRPLRATSDLSS